MDREKVIKGLNDIGGFIAERIGIEQARNFLRTIDNAIEFLKEQEARQVVNIADSIEGMEVGYCPLCGRTIVNKKIDETKFCKFCGQAVKWDN